MQLDRFLSKGADFYRQLMLNVAQSQHLRGRFMQMWLALNAGYAELVALFKLDQRRYRLHSALPNEQQTQTAVTHAINELSEIIRTGLDQRANMPSMTVKSHFDEMVRGVAEIKQAMAQLPQRNIKRAKQAADLTALNANLSAADLSELRCVVQLMATTALCELGAEVLEAEYQTMTPIEIDYLCRQLRLALQESIVTVRALQEIANQQALTMGREVQGENLYQRYQLIEELRNLAQAVSALGLKAINQKPPLIVRQSELNGTLHQVAHAFYGDYKRAAELLRLNPQIRNPNFIRQGELLNAYSE